MIFQYNIARITTSEAVYGRAGCKHFHSQEYGRAVCRVYVFPLPAVCHAGCVPFFHQQYGMQGAPLF